MTSTDGFIPQTLTQPQITRHIRGFSDTHISSYNARIDKMNIKFQSFYLEFDYDVNADNYLHSLARNVDEIQSSGRTNYQRFYLNKPLYLRNNRHNRLGFFPKPSP
jgi:hypothetical protein